MKWTAEDIPDLAGKNVLITGANSGLGFESAKALAGRGAHVIMACRNPQKAESSATELRTLHPRASLELVPLDLSSLGSVRALAQAVVQKHARLDLLLNNAGIMAVPYAKTADGFELQFGTNHLGHFALTGLLFDLLRKTAGSRVVNVSSQAHTMGKMRFDDLGWEHGYKKWSAYGMSKLANLLFTYELARKLEARALDMRCLAAHPGYAATNLQYAGADLQKRRFVGRILRWGNPLLGQPPEMGALPQLFAATSAEAANGDYIGPDALGGWRGYPRKVRSNRRSHDEADMRRLWEASEQLTGVTFAALA
jgi:NAD(P)-dependent dehydrogenase (short-subunit alcohol dehydrogenase family)